MYPLDFLFLLFFLALVWCVWAIQQRARNTALMQVRKLCKLQSLQLLDDTLVFEAVRPGRSARGHWCLIRRYGFEFSSTGEHRYTGTIELAGRRIHRTWLAPHQV